MELTTIRHGQLTHLAQALVSHGFPRPPTRKTMEKYGVITPKGKRGGRLGYHMNSDKKRKRARRRNCLRSPGDRCR